MIAFRQFCLRRGPRLLLKDVDLTIHAGWRVGVVGRNGCGKSSLFGVLLGEVEPDKGDVGMPKNLRIASVAQETVELDDSALDFVLGGDVASASAIFDAERAEAAGDMDAAMEAHHRIDELGAYDARARAAKLLHGLGFHASAHERPVREFSGGWRMRLNLGRALMAPSDLLLLDEPTNHLDLDAVVWLEEWIRRYEGTVLTISHDREFLDNIASHVLSLEDGRATLYVGNYFQFERQRAEQLRQQAATYAREQAERAHLQSFIDRFRAKASHAAQAQSRIKRIEKLQETEAVRADRTFRFDFPPPARLPDNLLRLKELDAGYGDFMVLHGIRFGLDSGDRIGLLGPNGEGKSTLVKTLAGELAPLGGERTAHPDLKVGYFAQHTMEHLDESASPLEHLQRMAPGESVQVLRSYLGGWDFAGDRAFETISGFSGGERARLALALVAWRRPNLLLLDEPTNHLDLDMREALAEALNDYPGAVVLVSHDRSLLGLVCDRFERVCDGTVEPFDGDLDDYARWLRSRRSEDAGVKAARREQAAAAAAERKQPVAARKVDRGLKKRIGALEAQIEQTAAAQRALEARLADPGTYASTGKAGADKASVAALTRQQQELAATAARLEAEWLALQEQLESA